MKRFLMILALSCFFVAVLAICAGAQTVVLDGSKDSSGDIFATVLCETETDKHISYVDIRYVSTSGEEKTAKVYYATSFWTNDRMRQLDALYLPSDFDLTQTVYFPDKLDVNGDGEFEQTELLKGTNGSDFKMCTYESFDGSELQGTVSVKASVQAVSYSKYQNYFGNNTFSRCADLKSVTYNGRAIEEYTCVISSGITRIMAGVFGGDGSAYNTVTSDFTLVIFEDRAGALSMGQYSFTRGVVKEFRFGSGSYSMHGNQTIAFQYVEDGSTDASIERFVLAKDTKFTSGNVSWNVGTYEVVVVGNEVECFDAYEANCKGAMANASLVIYNPCYYGHTEPEDDFDCTTAVVCAGCGDFEIKPAMAHANGESVAYTSYFENGSYYVGCQNEGCGVKTTTVLSPIVESLGYSTSCINGVNAIVQGYKINKEAIAKYAEFYSDVELGVVAAVNASGEAFAPDLGGAGVVSVKLAMVNDYVDIRVVGISEANLTKKIVICMYLTTGGRVYFLDNGNTLDRVVGTSYSDIAD